MRDDLNNVYVVINCVSPWCVCPDCPEIPRSATTTCPHTNWSLSTFQDASWPNYTPATRSSRARTRLNSSPVWWRCWDRLPTKSFPERPGDGSSSVSGAGFNSLESWMDGLFAKPLGAFNRWGFCLLLCKFDRHN